MGGQPFKVLLCSCSLSFGFDWQVLVTFEVALVICMSDSG